MADAGRQRASRYRVPGSQVPAARARAFATETPLGTKRRARKINRILSRTYPYAVPELDFENPFELLVATVLSAQTTDVRVNSVTPSLFARFPDAFALAGATQAEVEGIVKPLGFFRSKAAAIRGLSQGLVERFDGEVPGNLEQLVTLPGVGRKTANVVLNAAFGVPGLTVDTHFGRLVRRLGLTEETDPVVVEKAMWELFEPEDFNALSQNLVFHGRRICHARRPACGACPIATLCPSFGIGETDPEASRQLLQYEMAPGREELHALMLAGKSRRELRALGYELKP